MYRVISPFRDLKNNGYHYDVGDIYPVKGYKPTKFRIKELAEGKNPLNRVFIEEVEESPDTGEGEPTSETEEGKTEK